jgi:integrase
MPKKIKRARRLIERSIFRVDQQGGGITFWVQVSRGGRRAQKTCPTLEAARVLRDQWAREGLPVPGDKPPVPEAPDEDPTIEDALFAYIGTATQRHQPSTARITRFLIEAWRRDPAMRPWLAARVARLATSDLEQLLDTRLEHGRRATGQPLMLSGVLKEYRNLRAAVRLVRADLTWPRLGKALRAPILPRQPLIEGQEPRLLLALPEPYRTAAKLAMILNLRRSSLTQMRREHLHLNDPICPWLWLPDAKMGDERVPLGPEAVALCRAQLARIPPDAAWLFPSAYTQGRTAISGERLYQQLKLAARKIGRPDFRFHDLRHQFASNLLAQKYTLWEVQAAGRWKSPGVLAQRYAHMATGRVLEMQRAMAAGQAPHSARSVQ